MKDKIRLQFLGATNYVTGSRSLLETDQTRIYVDAGLYQGPKFVEEKNYQPLETEPEKIDAIFLTHAHIDHSGLLPLLVKKGFQGKIFAPPSTVELLHILLPDAGRLQEEEFKFLSRKKIRDFELDGPLFTEEDAKKTLEHLQAIPFYQDFQFQDFTMRYTWAGHIVGGASLRISKGDTSILFSGDLGPRNSIFHRVRDNPPPSDYVVMESTYGKRLHDQEDHAAKMKAAIDFIVRKKGMLVIPSFAVGRTQLVLYVIYKLIQENKIPALPIFIDSPMAAKATQVYLEHPHEIRKEIIEEGFIEFARSRDIRMIQAASESKMLNYFNGPGIIISASGMCNGGRVLHHLYNRIWDRRNMVLFVGYQAEGTLGRLILEGKNRIKIFNRTVPVRAKIAKINSFSAHADVQGLLAWLRHLKDTPPKKVFLNHGEQESREALKEEISCFKDTVVELPKSEEVFYL